jgi:hypothetical protein
MLAAGVGSFPGFDAGIVGPDLAIGLQYVFSPIITGDVRYRATILNFFDVPRKFEPTTAQYVIYHGPMVGISIKF